MKTGGKWNAEFDHVVALADGGRDEPENLQALTPECHHDKSAAEVERGYFKKQAYASRSSTVTCTTTWLPLQRAFAKLRCGAVCRRTLAVRGSVCAPEGHPYWEDGTTATVRCDDDGNLIAICVKHGSKMRDPLPPFARRPRGQETGEAASDAVHTGHVARVAQLPPGFKRTTSGTH